MTAANRASRWGKWRYSVPGSTPARLAMSSREASAPCSWKADWAGARPVRVNVATSAGSSADPVDHERDHDHDRAEQSGDVLGARLRRPSRGSSAPACAAPAAPQRGRHVEAGRRQAVVLDRRGYAPP
ncbi:hypothetical protein [Streptomyces sp. MspMP-M5]|uniref:hypothetical protein n=1 Tax=Streptomyces sp. MspMP-M5 TaxID=1155718 RepID=UPI003B64236D